VKLTPEIQTTLANVELAIVGQTLGLRLPAGLDRALYVKANKALEALGGKWNRGAKAHLFGNTSAAELEASLERAITLGEVTTAADLGFFATPPALAKKLVGLADVRQGMTALEPSAGEGAIVRELLRVGAKVTICERDPKRFAKAEAVASEFKQGARGPFINSWGRKPEDADGAFPAFEPFDDFMDVPAAQEFDRVVMNPPFCKVGKGDHLDHVYHAWQFLKPGGVLVAVLPSSVEFRTDKRHREFIAWWQDEAYAFNLQPLPAGSFKASGTMVNTCVLRMVKP